MPPRRCSGPTRGQTAAYEAVVEHGSQSAAAKALGRHQGSIRQDVLRYCQITDTPLPEGVNGQPRQISAATVLARTPERLDSIEEELRAMRAEVARLAALVESFVYRQPVILNAVPTHRRKADGGEGGRSEQRKLRPVVG